MGLSFNANYTYSHTLDNSTNEFFTSLLNPRRSQDTNRLSDDWPAPTWTSDTRWRFPGPIRFQTLKSDQPPGKDACQWIPDRIRLPRKTGQPVTLQSGLDSNGNGDSAVTACLQSIRFWQDWL